MARTTECGLLIKMISDSIARLSNNDLRENGLTLSQLRYLTYLYEHGDAPVPYKALEAHFHVAQPTVVGVLRRLVDKGLVTTLHGRGNAKLAALTAQGRLQCERSEDSRRATEERLLASLSEEDRARFEQMLRSVCHSLHIEA